LLDCLLGRFRDLRVGGLAEQERLDLLREEQSHGDEDYANSDAADAVPSPVVRLPRKKERAHREEQTEHRRRVLPEYDHEVGVLRVAEKFNERRLAAPVV